MSGLRIGTRTAGLAGTIAVALAAVPCHAKTVDLAIPPQSVSAALREFGRQTGNTVVFDIPGGETLASPGASGRWDQAKALRHLLNGNPFDIRPIPGGYAITRRERPARRLAAPPPPRPDALPVPIARATEDIVVSAQKRDERLIDVPMSITAIPAEALAASGIASTGDLEQIVPGLLTPNVGLAYTPAMRGVTTISTSPGDETNVAIYLDDVYLGAPIVGLFEFKDIERIEVLKGPQGNLFGRNATGGAIRVITRSPAQAPAAELSAEYGVAARRIRLDSFVTGPITKNLTASLNLGYTDDDGYIRGVVQNRGQRFGKLRSTGGRVKLHYEPDADLSITLFADAASRRDSGLYAWVPRDGKNANASLPGARIWGPFQYGGSTVPVAALDNWGVGLRINWDGIPGLTIRSITGYRDARGFYQTDTDRLNLPISALQLRQNQRNLSQELFLTTPSGRKWEIVAGLYYYHSRAWNPFFNAYLGDAPSGTIVTSFTNNVVTDSFALFGEITLNATDRLHLTGGARYTTETKSGSFRFVARPQGLLHDALALACDSPTYRAIVRYDVDDDANVYLTASNGFKSGVFNAYAYPLVAVKPEKIDALEAGVKGRIADLTYSLAAFRYNYRNIQLQGQTQVGGVFLVTLTNAARARIRGFEATLAGKFDRHLSFDLGASVIPVARYTSFPAAQVFVPDPKTGGNRNIVPFDATGSRAIRSPTLQANARLSYASTALGGEMAASASYAYKDASYNQPGNFTRQPSYHVVNARIAWTEPRGRFTFSVSGENLTDETYSFYTTDSLAGTVDVLARPREINFGVTAKL